jgi:hypothetical protein
VNVSTTDRNHHPYGYVAAEARGRENKVEVTSWSTSCAISGDPTNPGVSVHLALPVSSKATFKEMTFTRTVQVSTDGLPILNHSDAVVCVGDNGAPSDYSMLLMPAVQ